jgi:hypothetical protein
MNIQNLSSDFCEWSLQYHPVKKEMVLHGAPPLISISEYPSWKAVIDNILPILNASTEFTMNPSEKVRKLVQKWIDQSSDPYERVRLAARFIQEFGCQEYLFIQIGRYKKIDLNTVMNNRDVNIYDQILLLHGLLKLMGISSTLILTNNFHQTITKEAIPQHDFFYNALLRVDFENKVVYVDLSKRGSIGKNIIGLPLSQEADGLISIPTEFIMNPLKEEFQEKWNSNSPSASPFLSDSNH